MSTLTIHRLETLLVTANALLTAPHPEVEALDAYHDERERIFAHLWDEPPQSGGERSVVESFVTEILLQSTLIGAKGRKLHLALLEAEFASASEKVQ